MLHRIRERAESVHRALYLSARAVEAESHSAGLGLQQETPSMCQIPTYVTKVASGREKVGSWVLSIFLCLFINFVKSRACP